MNYQVSAAIRSDMLRLTHKPHTCNLKAKPITKDLIMIAWNIDHFGAVASHTQDQANDFIMMGIPIPGTPQAPPVDNVAHQIEFFTLDATQEIYQGVASAASQAKMNIGNKNRAVASRR
jgi:hypothetical protein